MPNSYFDSRLNVKFYLEGNHIVISGDSVDNPIQTEGIILGYLAHLFKAKDIIQV